jgi:nicotinate-nucleotide--dimethylbenzimidazole phosphoribosyltransferase
MTQDSHAPDPAEISPAEISPAEISPVEIGPAETAAFYRVAGARRDVRNGFLPDPVDDDMLTRVLAAAHQAPSVGLSQPWDFLILRDREVRMSAQRLAQAQRDAFAATLPRARALAFGPLKVEAILESPVNVVVTCDATRGGRHVLGRHAQPQVAEYSAVCAVQNLWLAARAEGLGVGWVSFFDERELAAVLGLPAHVTVVAYLCVGHVARFPPAPELVMSGWARQRPLAWAVHQGRWGQRGLPGAEPASLLDDTVAAVGPPDAAAAGAARERQAQLTKPPGSLGFLEDLSVRLAGIAGQCPPPVPEPAAVAVFAGDHGVHAQGVTPWPQEVTAQMVANFLASTAVVNVIAAQAGAEVCVVDVGVAADLPAAPGLLPRKVRRGTADMTEGPAMTRDEARQAVETGIETARDLVTAGSQCLVTGDMGIANTTASAALIAAFTGAGPAEVTGRGTGVDDPTLARKTDVVRRALDRHRPDPADPLGTLAAVGGLEHAALAGYLLGAAAHRVPVLLDGVIACAAALAAAAFCPAAVPYMIAGHRSTEPGASRALAALGLRPVLDLDLRLGEGSGAVLALPIVQAAARVLRDVATFDSAGVSGKKE